MGEEAVTPSTPSVPLLGAGGESPEPTDSPGSSQPPPLLYSPVCLTCADLGFQAGAHTERINPCPTCEGIQRYRTVVADPPWPYRTSETGSWVIPKNEGEEHQRRVDQMGYGVMSMADLLSLRPPAADDAHLYLWTTNAFMDEAHDLCRAWGFAPKTICTYGKVQPDGSPSMKTGYYFRGATEHWIFGVRGSLRLQTTEGLPTLWLWPRFPHSVKPDAFYDLVEKASPGPYLEMFSRRSRFGWDYWGDESLGTAEVAVA